MSKNSFYSYLPDGVTFYSTDATHLKAIYAPLCGTDASSLKSAITPSLSGDIKVDKFHYLTKPTSREDLRAVSREFFVTLKGKGVFSLTQESAPNSAEVTVGQLWHQLKRTHRKAGLELTAVNFIPSSNEILELMRVTIKNISSKAITVTPTAAIPIFGRSLANKHDHEHVTALLNRVEQNLEGVLVEPSMAFNEEGHKNISNVYFVYGREGNGANITGSFPTADSFYGDGGSLEKPEAILANAKPTLLTEAERQGKEAVGALRFKEATLKPGKAKEYIVAIGLAVSRDKAKQTFTKFDSSESFNKAWDANKNFWSNKTASIQFNSGDDQFNAWMSWVTIQPILRRIFGCSFLPDHDYGKGGKGWRDIWQDLLSLILIEPQLVREDLINNCAGIRIDGSNATIIGNKPGEFLADRNAITRVWMDHGAWPFLTLALYIDQTGDIDILLHKQSYFKDPQMSRTFEKDIAWVSQYGNKLFDKKGHVYEGTIVEHLLVQNLTQFFNVGEHNIIRLESADWNDGLDMAFAQGESVAFTSFYGGNLLKIADILETLGERKGATHIHVAKELLILLDTLGEKSINYDHAQDKRNHLFGKYYHSVQPNLSGDTVDVSIKDVAHDLRIKGHWIFAHIRKQEKITISLPSRGSLPAGKAGAREGCSTYTWFNGYYDNRSERVEGEKNGAICMTLTGQVFAVMSGLADPTEIKGVITSVDKFLKDPKLGGYRLNTDFGLRHYLDLGRAFGFAYGTKENGAFFSHMIVMYAYAMYKRGFAREGYKVLQSIYKMATDVKRSKIYPGIPEYFDSEGRGMYHYLTGSASWLVLTQLTQAFGVRGSQGDLVLAPQLVKEEFNKKGIAAVSCQFASKHITVEYHNPKKLDAGAYQITDVSANGLALQFNRLDDNGIRLKRALITQELTLKVTLA